MASVRVEPGVLARGRGRLRGAERRRRLRLVRCCPLLGALDGVVLGAVLLEALKKAGLRHE